MTIDELLGHLAGVRRSGAGWVAQCPGHPDTHASLSIGLGEDGRFLLHDHAGCDLSRILAPLGLEVRDLFNGAEAPAHNGRTTARTEREAPEIEDLGPATDAQAEALRADGRLTLPETLARMGTRCIRWQGREWLAFPALGGAWKAWGIDRAGRIRRDGRSLVRRNVGPVSLVLSPDLRDRDEGAGPVARLYDLEGESDLVAWVGANGTTALASTGGAMPTTGHDRAAATLRALRPAEVVVVRDRDDAGRKGAETAASWWLAQGVPVRVLALPDVLGEGGDVRDYLREVGGVADLDALAEEAERREPRGGDSAEAEWEEPVPFGGATHGPPLALEALPEPVREYVAAVAESVQIAPDFVAACALGTLAAAAGRRAEVAIGETHREPLNLYMFPTLGPGERKVVVRRVAAPLYEVEAELGHERAQEILRNDSERSVLERRCEVLERDAAKAADAVERAAAVAEVAKLRASMPEALRPPRLTIDDATPEATARILAEQGGACAIVSEEAGSLFETLAGKYRSNGAADLDLHLKAYDGGAVRVHRISREPLEVPAACLTILTTPQPSILDRLGELPEFRGRGLLGRACFVLPESRVGFRMYQDRAVPAALEGAWRDLVARLARLPVRPPGEVPALPIQGEALEVWRGFADRLEAEQAEGARLAGIRDWASKHAGRAARIAGLFHLVRHVAAEAPWQRSAAAEDVSAAWAVAEWLTEHALAAYARMGATPEEQLARRVLRWLRREGATVVSLRDVHRAHRDARPLELEAALRGLAERGYVRHLPDPPRRGGRPPSPRWVVHPEVSG